MTDAPVSSCSISASLITVRCEIAAAAKAVGRKPDETSLVAVSKTQPIEALEAALAAGQRVFGENRVQEAKTKWPELRTRHSDIELHLIGALQTNKVRDAVALFDVIQTVDRPRLAEALAEEFTRTQRRPRCLIEVNTGEESQKAGIAPIEVPAFLDFCRDRCQLPISGLMAIPPVDEEPALHFALLADLAHRLNLPEISMGMSQDYPIAVRFGATLVRVGTAIFGGRNSGAPQVDPLSISPLAP
ncbi:Pyridoxal phosphate homeostasis protein [Azospirillaceae bacterium]